MEEAIPVHLPAHAGRLWVGRLQLPPTTFFASARGEEKSVTV